MQANESAFRLIQAGVDGLLLRVELIDRAQTTLDLQYYIFRGDDTGHLVQAALLRAADRGVRIRILVDDADTVPGDEKLLLFCAHPQIEVRVFNPFDYRGHNAALRAVDFLVHKSRLDYRMHNKLLVADGVVALTGGRNVGDQYFQVDPRSQFGDDDVLTVGALVPALRTEFNQYWESDHAVDARWLVGARPADALAGYRLELARSRRVTNDYLTDYERRLPLGEPLRSIMTDADSLTRASGVVVYDSPDKKAVRARRERGRLMYDAIAQECRAVRTQLFVITPFLVPTSAETRLLDELRGRNVDVRMLTNSLMSNPSTAAQAGYMRERPAMLKSGIELHEIRPELGSARGSGESKKLTQFGHYALHGKVMTFDRTSVFVGSMNLDQRSAHLNTEMGLILHSDRLTDDMLSRFAHLTELENAYSVTLARPSEPATLMSRLIWRTRERGETVEYRTEPARSFLQRWGAWLLCLLPIRGEE